jgi:hypothetical protein
MRALIGLSLFLFLATGLQAKEAKEVVEISEEENEKLALQVQEEVKKQIKKYVTPLFLAKKLKMPFPPVEPTKSISAIQKEAAKVVLEKVNIKYPLTEVAKRKAEAHKKYFMYSIGDIVPAIRIRAGGRGAVIQGKFQGFNKKGQLLVGEGVVAKVDMKEAFMVHFDPVLNKKKLTALITNKLYYFYEDRKKMTKEISPAVEKEIFMASGYFIEGKKFLTAGKYLQQYYIKQKGKIARDLSVSIANSLYGSYGFVKHGETWKKGSYSNDDIVEVEKLVREPLFDTKFYDRDF